MGGPRGLGHKMETPHGSLVCCFFFSSRRWVFSLSSLPPFAILLLLMTRDKREKKRKKTTKKHRSLSGYRHHNAVLLEPKDTPPPLLLFCLPVFILFHLDGPKKKPTSQPRGSTVHDLLNSILSVKRGVFTVLPAHYELTVPFTVSLLLFPSGLGSIWVSGPKPTSAKRKQNKSHFDYYFHHDLVCNEKEKKKKETSIPNSDRDALSAMFFSRPLLGGGR
ncbi:hypothetical protein LZ31DRAFT_48234 [Colletotrichum somersetense]|nr:hypothetical protein LZ31DRAFT_48234 [Colletotrichum somersetense]